MSSKEHAVVIVGYSWRKSVVEPMSSSSHVWEQVDTLLTVDDNLLPYGNIPLHSGTTKAGSPPYTTEDFDAFIVALPDKIYYPADAIERLSRRVGSWLVRSWGADQDSIKLRRYFITTVSDLRKHARDNHTYLGNTLVGLMMRLDTAQFVWVVEYCSVEQWQRGHVTARTIVDATASPQDPVPLWLLYDETAAVVFDRSSAEWSVDSINLDRNGLGPFPRIELNPATGGGARDRCEHERRNCESWR